jgi:hypothetical protein
MIILMCIDDTNKPDCAPQDKWLVKGDIYHCKHICKKSNGYILEEIDIRKHCPNLPSFNRKRFRAATHDEVMADKCVKELLKDLNLRVN